MAKKESWNPLLRAYPESRKVNSVSIGAETMFTRLLARCDDQANYYGEPALLLCHLFGRRFAAGGVSVTDMERWRDELVTATLLDRYEVDGEVYVHVRNCKKMLRADINADIQFPGIDEDTQTITRQGVPESVTGPLRARNENVSPPSPSPSPSASDAEATPASSRDAASSNPQQANGTPDEDKSYLYVANLVAQEEKAEQMWSMISDHIPALDLNALRRLKDTLMHMTIGPMQILELRKMMRNTKNAKDPSSYLMAECKRLLEEHGGV